MLFTFPNFAVPLRKFDFFSYFGNYRIVMIIFELLDEFNVTGAFNGDIMK